MTRFTQIEAQDQREREAMTTLRTARLTLSLIARVVSGSHKLFKLCGHWNGNLQGDKHCIALKKKKRLHI